MRGTGVVCGYAHRGQETAQVQGSRTPRRGRRPRPRQQSRMIPRTRWDLSVDNNRLLSSILLNNISGLVRGRAVSRLKTTDLCLHQDRDKKVCAVCLDRNQGDLHRSSRRTDTRVRRCMPARQTLRSLLFLRVQLLPGLTVTFSSSFSSDT